MAFASLSSFTPGLHVHFVESLYKPCSRVVPPLMRLSRHQVNFILAKQFPEDESYLSPGKSGFHLDLQSKEAREILTAARYSSSSRLKRNRSFSCRQQHLYMAPAISQAQSALRRARSLDLSLQRPAMVVRLSSLLWVYFLNRNFTWTCYLRRNLVATQDCGLLSVPHHHFQERLIDCHR